MLQSLTVQQRDALIRFKRETVMFPQFQSAYASVRDALALFRASGLIQSHLLLGASGCGKSTLCKMILAENPSFEEPERTVVPVLYVRVPALATVYSLAETLLVALGDPAPYSGNATAKTHRLITLILACGVQMIILDEMQHIHDRGQSPTVYRVADWIKSLADAVGIPFVIAGLPRTTALIETNEQLRRRFSATLPLDRMGFTGDRQIADFASTVASLVKAMPVKSAFSIDDMEAIERIHYASDGRIGYLVSLLLRSLTIAYAIDQHVVDLAILEQAFEAEIWRDGVNAPNPFSKNFCNRRLDRIGEPFSNASQPIKKRKADLHKGAPDEILS